MGKFHCLYSTHQTFLQDTPYPYFNYLRELNQLNENEGVQDTGFLMITNTNTNLIRLGSLSNQGSSQRKKCQQSLLQIIWLFLNNFSPAYWNCYGSWSSSFLCQHVCCYKNRSKDTSCCGEIVGLCILSHLMWSRTYFNIKVRIIKFSNSIY